MKFLLYNSFACIIEVQIVRIIKVDKYNYTYCVYVYLLIYIHNTKQQQYTLKFVINEHFRNVLTTYNNKHLYKYKI
jgi:hypothetical protein